jgi:FYVE/RhoGEF/PH domain-containing protein 5/6
METHPLDLQKDRPFTTDPKMRIYDSQEKQRDFDKSEQWADTRRIVTQKLVNTESVYVLELTDLMELYVNPLFGNILSESEYVGLFSNLKQITAFHMELVCDLKGVLNPWHDKTSALGDVFLKHAPSFQLYSVYVNNQDLATRAFVTLLQNNPGFAEFSSKAQANPRSRGLTLPNFLLLPSMQIRRYRPMLQEILDTTEPAHPDYDPLTSAITVFNEVTADVSNQIKAYELQSDVTALEHLLKEKVELVQPGRWLVRQGKLIKKCRNKNKEYTFILFNDMLIYCSTTMSGNLQLHHKLMINSSFSVHDQPDSELEKFCWQIMSDEKSFVVIAPDNAIKEQWLCDLRMCINQVHRQSQLSSLLPDSSVTDAVADRALAPGVIAPVLEQQSDSRDCHCCHKNWTIFRRRHHCHNCGYLVCDSCSTDRIPTTASVKNNADPERICDACVSGYNAEKEAKIHRETDKVLAKSANMSSTSFPSISNSHNMDKSNNKNPDNDSLAEKNIASSAPISSNVSALSGYENQTLDAKSETKDYSQNNVSNTSTSAVFDLMHDFELHPGNPVSDIATDPVEMLPSRTSATQSGTSSSICSDTMFATDTTSKSRTLQAVRPLPSSDSSSAVTLYSVTLTDSVSERTPSTQT